ncbi:MAG: aKG-HExxH-type peptide beta-hydroxylase, partial [Steroidobacteraceae bacterium]
PAARMNFDRFVKIIVHLPDLESRSCSAARFAGAILLSSGDDTMLAMAESLVHECGHQALYCVMELEPLICDAGQRSFTLPWSGSQRDAYGYFHAAYIYLLLALFYERVVNSGRDDQADAQERLAAILAGLDRALCDFANADFFTEAGKAFFNRLANQSVTVIERNHHRSAEALQSGKRHGSQGNAADAEYAAAAS